MSIGHAELEVHAAQATNLQIYWAGENENYSESRTNKVRVYPQQHHYKLSLGDLTRINRLRIDPSTGINRIVIRQFSLFQFGLEPLRLLKADQLQRIRPFRRIASYEVGERGIEIATGGPDPQMELLLDDWERSATSVTTAALWRALVVLAIAVMLASAIGPMSKDYRFVPYAMLAAFSMIFVMATISRINAHPDEYVHILAARYYVDHHLPPAACDEEIRHTFSPYGASRLNTTEIAYYLAGKFAGALAFLPVTESFELRYYNVFLFAVLLLLSIRIVAFRMLCIPLLVSPQAWYLFSYVNSEGTAIFAGLIAAHQLIDDRSWFRRIVAGTPLRHRWLKAALLGALLAALLEVKKNFFVVDLYLFIWFVLAMVLAMIPGPLAVLRRCAPILIIGVALYGAWIGAHHAVNDFNRTDAIAECRKQLALPSYAEGATLEQSHPTLYWRDKGRPFSTLFEHDWGARMFRSAMGHFGYLEIPGSPHYYAISAWLLIAFGAWLLFDSTRSGGRFERLNLLAAIAMFALLIGATLWKDWTRDFQPQGRYLAPMIPIIGMVLATGRGKLNERAITVLVGALFALSMYFFVFVGITGIRKY